MIVDDFHVVRVAILPAEANPLLVVYSNALLAGAMAGEFLQPIP